MKNNSNSRTLIGIVVIVVIVGLSCTMTGDTTSLDATKVALEVQMTVLAHNSSQQQQEDTSTNNQPVDSAGTLVAQQGTQIAQQATQLAQMQAPVTQPPAQPVDTQPPPVVTEAPVVDDIEDKIKNAKILLFEDMAGTGNLEYIQEALEMGGYKFKDDGSAQGWFKDDLLSTSDWNLIIAGSESRTKIQGEFFVYLLEQINRGAAVIIEHWAIDNLSFGKVAPILSKCGVELHRDWFVPFNVLPNLSVWPLIPDHPVFNEPNKGISLRNFGNFWSISEDKGDLLRLTGSGDATLLAGTIATAKSDHGTLVTCLEGRLVIQTFSSHEYNRDDITRLWENYIHYTLKNHFLTAP